MPKTRRSVKSSSFTESIIGEITRLSAVHGAINLGEGNPDVPAPDEVKEAARRAIADDHNQYPVTWGVPEFREAIAVQYQRLYAMRVDPEREICVTCGSTEAMIAAILGLVDPGDEIVIFEPFYENYGPDAALAGAVPRVVTLHAPDWTLDEAELRAAFSDRTRAIVVNSPNNPTGKVFTREELSLIAELCVAHDVVAITDEIYEHLTYDGVKHVPIATIPGMEDRTVTISALSKTYSVTGWRVGWAIAAPPLTDALRPIHDYLTVAAPTPLQVAGITALGLPDSYYQRVVAEYDERRALLLSILTEAGFRASPPKGAYYVMADISHLDYPDDVAAARDLVERIGVGSVPGSSFFSEPKLGAHLLRFTFCKKLETLRAAGERLEALRI